MRWGRELTRRALLGGLAVAALSAGCGRGGRPRAPASPDTGRPAGADAPKMAEQNRAPTPPADAVDRAPAASPDSAPAFSNVAEAGPDEIARYFAGRHPFYPDASSSNFLGYSPADILESMDTADLDEVGALHGDEAVRTIHGIVARSLLESLLAVYGSRSVLLALDAGHGGKKGVFYDPGSNGTEAQHTRAVVALVEQLAQDSRYAQIAIRRIFNDAIGDDFSLPPPEDSKTRASLVIRNGRASMLAYEVNAWNRSHPDRPVAMHVVSVHFNANSGGTLVLHEGDDVPAEFQRLSVAYARDYVDRVRPALNGSGLLPRQLGLVNGSGLHDDSLMYPPPVRAGGARVNPFTGNAMHGPPRYAMLQASLLEQDYVVGLLHYRGLA